MLLYYITDSRQFPGEEPTRRHRLLDKIADAARCGVNFIQLREKALTARELEQLTRAAVDTIRNASLSPPQAANSANQGRTRLLVNSRTDVALAGGADGVHLRADDVSPRDAREVAQARFARVGRSRDWLVAVSCHSEEEVRRAACGDADFVVFAPVFEKHGMPQARAAGLDALRNACSHSIPVIALGGVTLENAPRCMEAGAAGIAGIRLFQENDIPATVARLRALDPR